MKDIVIRRTNNAAIELITSLDPGSEIYVWDQAFAYSSPVADREFWNIVKTKELKVIGFKYQFDHTRKAINYEEV